MSNIKGDEVLGTFQLTVEFERQTTTNNEVRKYIHSRFCVLTFFVRHRFEIVAVIIFVTLSIAFAGEPMECSVGQHYPFPFHCRFENVKGSEKDTTKVKVLPIPNDGRNITKDNVTAVIFSESEFDEIPSGIFEENLFGGIAYLKFSGGSIRSINAQSLEKASKLKFLEFSDSTLHAILPEAFKLAMSLEFIIIQDCTIESFSEDAFVGMKTLKIVQWAMNFNTDKNLIDFKDIPGVTMLRFRNNRDKI